jgi:hypothetical protein
LVVAKAMNQAGVIGAARLPYHPAAGRDLGKRMRPGMARSAHHHE